MVFESGSLIDIDINISSNSLSTITICLWRADCA
jgi:hypothetical protein